MATYLSVRVKPSGTTYFVGDILRMKTENEEKAFASGAIFPDNVIVYIRGDDKGTIWFGLARARALAQPFTGSENYNACVPLLTYERWEVAEASLPLFLHFKMTRQ